MWLSMWLKAKAAGDLRRLSFLLNFLRTLQTFHKIAHIISATADNDAGEKDPQPRPDKHDADHREQIRAGGHTQQHGHGDGPSPE